MDEAICTQTGSGISIAVAVPASDTKHKSLKIDMVTWLPRKVFYSRLIYVCLVSGPVTDEHNNRRAPVASVKLPLSGEVENSAGENVIVISIYHDEPDDLPEAAYLSQENGYLLELDKAPQMEVSSNMFRPCIYDTTAV